MGVVVVVVVVVLVVVVLVVVSSSSSSSSNNSNSRSREGSVIWLGGGVNFCFVILLSYILEAQKIRDNKL